MTFQYTKDKRYTEVITNFLSLQNGRYFIKYL